MIGWTYPVRSRGVVQQYISLLEQGDTQRCASSRGWPGTKTGASRFGVVVARVSVLLCQCRSELIDCRLRRLTRRLLIRLQGIGAEIRTVRR
jgi:hypothetical protein